MEPLTELELLTLLGQKEIIIAQLQKALFKLKEVVPSGVPTDSGPASSPHA